MAGNLLFVVHGMGLHPAGWEKEVRDKLTECAGRYAEFAAAPESVWDDVELVPVTYDDTIEKVRALWKQDAGGVLAFANQNKLPDAGDLSWLAPLAQQDQQFFWERVVDVVIYRFFAMYRDAIRASVVRQIVDRILELPDRSFERCTLVAHSLGTSVLHDSLHLLGTTRFAGLANAYSPPEHRFRALYMLANVARLLENDIKVKDSIVAGGPRNSAVSNCARFLGFRHQWDPICVPKPFEPEGWPEAFNRFRKLTHFRDWNVHGFTHYLDNPRVHIPLINSMRGEELIGADERDAELERYETFGGKLKEAAELQANLQRLGAAMQKLHENSDFSTLFAVAREVRGILADMKDDVERLKKDLGA